MNIYFSEGGTVETLLECNKGKNPSVFSFIRVSGYDSDNLWYAAEEFYFFWRFAEFDLW